MTNDCNPLVTYISINTLSHAPAFLSSSFYLRPALQQSFAAAAAKLLQSCPTLCNATDSSPPGSRPWDSPGKNTGVGCHFLLQCMKVKSESEELSRVRPSATPWTAAYLGSSIHEIFQARVLEWGAIAFSEQSFDPPLKRRVCESYSSQPSASSQVLTSLPNFYLNSMVQCHRHPFLSAA